MGSWNYILLKPVNLSNHGERRHEEHEQHAEIAHVGGVTPIYELDHDRVRAHKFKNGRSRTIDDICTIRFPPHPDGKRFPRNLPGVPPLACRGGSKLYFSGHSGRTGGREMLPTRAKLQVAS